MRDAGVRRITGDLVADESYFRGVRFGYGWEWNDLQWSYGAEVSALSVDDNVVLIRVAPATKPGIPCAISIVPATSYVRIVNRTRTNPKSGPNDLGIYRAEGSNVIDVWGHIPVGGTAYTGAVAVHDPAGMFGTLLRAALVRRQIVVSGEVTSVDSRTREDSPFDPSRAVEIAFLESDSLADVVHETNKVSQNLYAELLLRTVGRVTGPPDATSSESAGIVALMELLKSIGVDTSAIALDDGSGLSRGNYVTPAATVGLLAWTRTQSFGELYASSLPEAGSDGTLEHRFGNTLAAGRVRAKTGTLGDASALSGFLTTRSGKNVVFSIMANNAPGDPRDLRKAIDSVVMELIAD